MQRYFSNQKDKDYLIIKSEDLHHIKNVMRYKPKDKVECIYDKELYICEIEDLNSTKIKIISKEEDNNELQLDITIAIALVKEQKMDLILQKLTELGVNKIIPLKMERSIVKLDSTRFQKKKERWTAICKEASEQSKRNIIPEITNIMTIEDLKNEKYDYKFICSTITNDKVTNYLKGNISDEKILFIIGPEGGISKEEEQKLIKQNMISISLGPRIMRVETAAIYIASITNFLSLGAKK